MFNLTGAFKLFMSHAACLKGINKCYCVASLCTTPNMDQWRQRAELSGELRKKIIGISVKGQGYRTIFKELHVPMATVVVIIKKYNAHWTVVSLTGHGCKRKSQVHHKDSSDGRKRSKETKLSSKVKVRHSLCTMYYDIIYIYFNDDLHGRRCRKNTKKAKLEIARTRVDKPQCFWQNVETKLELFSPPTSAHFLQKEKWSFKRKPWTCAGHKSQDYPSILEWNILQSVRKLSLCKRSRAQKHKNTRMAEAKNWLFLNGSPWAQSLSQPKDLRENLKIAVLRRHPETAWAARWGKVGQTTCWQMQTSHCELQRSLIGNDIKLRVPSFLSILIL